MEELIKQGRIGNGGEKKGGATTNHYAAKTHIEFDMLIS